MSDFANALVPVALVLAPVLMEVTEAVRSPSPEDAPAAPSTPHAASAPDDEEVEEFDVDENAFLAPSPAGRVRIASFNMLNVGERREKDYARLARTVEQYDVTSVLELQNEQALRDLTAALGEGWSYLISDREAGDPARSGTFEFYGFVYRTAKVTPLDAPTGFFPDPDGIFSREPFFASFRSGSFDFTLVALHAESPGNSAPLTRELENLANVFNHVQDLDPRENDVLLMGDFNRSPSTASGGTTAAWRPLFAIPQMDCVIPDTELTTLSSKPQGFANHYDDICLTRDNTRELTGTQGSFDFVQAMFEGKNTPAKRFVADHLPVWAEFRTDLPDDDASAPGPAPSDCCRICRTSKACGNSCIAREHQCTQEPGCACDG